VTVPRLLIITDRRATGGRSLVEVVRAALRGVDGAGLAPAEVAVQLREKDLPGRALVELARPLRAVTAAAGVALYVNDRVDVALAVDADGVHLGGGALGVADAARIAPHLSLAVSTHGLPDLAAARDAGGARLAFAVFGPIGDTPSKRPYGPPLGLAALAAAAQLGVPLIAVGGVKPRGVPDLLRAGARGVACIRAIMADPAPEAAVKEFCKHLATAW
jgi:thiamine-phosphate pyrophosphorylase